jgi:hypothetical protein
MLDGVGCAFVGVGLPWSETATDALCEVDDYHPIGPGAAAGTIFGLGADRFEDALGLAATQACGLMAAQFEWMGKRMQHGFAARNGVLAATLAAGGYTGIKQVFERPYGGFLSVVGEGHDPDPTQIVDGLGERWETEVVDKFRTLVAPLLEPARADAIERAVLHLEELTDATELIELLAAAV